MTALMPTPTTAQLLEDRAIILRVLGERWDSLVDNLEDTHGRERTFFQTASGLTEGFLLNASRPYAHPSLTDEDCWLYMLDLRDALNALSRYETDGLRPETMDGEEYAYHSDDMVLARLNDDVELALWPLLHGQSVVSLCAECHRVSATAVSWQPRTTGRRCAQHTLVSA